QYLSLQADLGRHFAVPPGRVEQALRERLGAGVGDGTTGRRDDGTTRSRRPVVPSSRRLPARGLLLALTGLAAGLLLAVLLWPRPGPAPAETAAEATDDTVAVLIQAPGATWDQPGPPPRAGATLHPGWLRLKSGCA